MKMIKQDRSGDGAAISLVWFILLNRNPTLPKVCTDTKTYMMISDLCFFLTLQLGKNLKQITAVLHPLVYVLNINLFPLHTYY